MRVRRAVFLDRDGVVNRAVVRYGKPYPPGNLDELVIPDDVPLAMAQLVKGGYMLIVVTNQPDVARGNQAHSVVESINRYLMSQLPIKEVFVCYHDDVDNCDCRKPSPGLLQLAADKYELDLDCSFLIGDRWKDIQAGQRAGCQSILIDYGYQEDMHGVEPDKIVQTFTEASEWILSMEA